MQNMNDVRDKFKEFAEACIESSEELAQIMEEFEAIVGGGTEYFPVAGGFKGMGYRITRNAGGRWTWVFEDDAEGPEWSEESFETRREAMLDAARDSDMTMLVDDNLGVRIRNAI